MYDEIKSAGAELIAISPQTVDKNAEIKSKQRLAFDVLSDRGNEFARQLGLVFGFPADLKQVYTDFGIVLPQFNGDDSWELPISSRWIVGNDKTIRSVEADPDYTHRPEPEQTIQELKQLF